jgi:hypothetical protein
MLCDLFTYHISPVWLQQFISYDHQTDREGKYSRVSHVAIADCRK